MKEQELEIILGAGNIGSAIAHAFISDSRRVVIWNRSERRLKDFSLSDDTSLTTDLGMALAKPGRVYLCVESHATIELAARCHEIVGNRNGYTFISCAASVNLAQLAEALGENARIARLLPNVAAIVQSSTSLLCTHNIDENGIAELKTVLAPTGFVHHCPEEKFGAAMALSSCGVAYIARYIRACMEAGVAMGLDARTARDLTVETMAGVAKIFEKDETLHPEVLIDSVCTPGGITIDGLNEMETQGFSPAIVAGLTKAGRKV